jgi:hypothetical protein
MLAHGIAAEKLNPQLSEQEGYCGSLKSWRNEENVKDNLVQSSLRLNISVPQIYEDQRLKNYVSPEFWDKGITALNLGWMANAWNSHTSSVAGRITAAPIWRQRRSVVGRLAAEAHRQPELAAAALAQQQPDLSPAPYPAAQLHRQRRADFHQW